MPFYFTGGKEPALNLNSTLDLELCLDLEFTYKYITQVTQFILSCITYDSPVDEYHPATNTKLL